MAYRSRRRSPTRAVHELPITSRQDAGGGAAISSWPHLGCVLLEKSLEALADIVR